MTYHAYWGLAACVATLVLNGCSATGPRAASPDVAPPPWNSLEMFMMDTEIVSIDHPGQKTVNTEPASELRIAGARSAS